MPGSDPHFMSRANTAKHSEAYEGLSDAGPFAVWEGFSRCTTRFVGEVLSKSVPTFSQALDEHLSGAFGGRYWRPNGQRSDPIGLAPVCAAIVTTAESGWLISWAIAAVSSPSVVTRATCASSARA